ncbi:MAG TPA: YkgJ family cysteine cluster protein, partial [Prolixibacteraceae bacterium]|nr:YkgJ family cysteine cluster protein [Prolixibacteraceae bacterium]
MNESSQKAIRNYLSLRDEIDTICSSLHKKHNKYTSCDNGCDECCMNFRLLPVEFYSILFSAKESNLKYLNNSEEEGCPFLIRHSCAIYPHRPIICRSHGLPILDMDQEGENWELSFCPLNFKNNEDEYFTHSNCYHQDVFNSKLYMLNLEFIKTLEGI